MAKAQESPLLKSIKMLAQEKIAPLRSAAKAMTSGYTTELRLTVVSPEGGQNGCVPGND
jgi:hypothetical protein